MWNTSVVRLRPLASMVRTMSILPDWSNVLEANDAECHCSYEVYPYSVLPFIVTSCTQQSSNTQGYVYIGYKMEWLSSEITTDLGSLAYKIEQSVSELSHIANWIRNCELFLPCIVCITALSVKSVFPMALWYSSPPSYICVHSS